jgi:hypothetical protein
MKLPGVFVVYAGARAVFGSSVSAIRIALLLANLATAGLLLVLGRRLLDPTAGWVAAASFAVLAVGPAVQGMFANAEHFVVLFAVVGFVLLLRALERERAGALLPAGLMFGVAVLMKQHGALFAVPAALQIVLASRVGVAVPRAVAVRRLAAFACGVVVPYALTCAVLAAAGAFDEFRFWTIEYAWKYASRITLAGGWAQLVKRTGELVADAPLLWGLVALGLTAVAWDPVARKRASFVLTLAASSVLAVGIGLYFRPHYFVLLLPAAALLAGAAVVAVARRVSSLESTSIVRWTSAVLVVGCVATPLIQQRDLLFRASPIELTRAVFTLNPFPESVEIGRYLEANSDPGATIAVFGSEPQIYFYAKRRSASRHVYMYPMMEPHDRALAMQQEMVREVAAARPEFMVYVRTSGSWLRGKDSPRLSVNWYQDYAGRYYDRVGLVQIFPDGTTYDWGPDIPWPPEASRWIEIVRRKR